MSSASTAPGELGIVVVAFEAPELLGPALDSVRGRPLVVVDNSSSPTIAAVTRGRGVAYVDPGRNLGFAAGVNLGVDELWKRWGDRDVLLLNPDARLGPDDADHLHAALRAEPGLAAVAPSLLGADGPQRAAWPFPRPARMWREALGVLGRSRDDADWLVGAALMLRADAYREVGPFDETFFLYGEETDWQRRCVEAGWQVRLVPDVVVQHIGAGSSSDSRRREALFHAGQETYIRKWFGASGWTSYRLAALVGAAGRSVLPGARGAAARGRLGLYLRGPRRVAGLSDRG